MVLIDPHIPIFTHIIAKLNHPTFLQKFQVAIYTYRKPFYHSSIIANQDIL